MLSFGAHCSVECKSGICKSLKIPDYLYLERIMVCIADIGRPQRGFRLPCLVVHSLSFAICPWL